MIRQYWEEGRLATLDAELPGEGLGDARRFHFGSIHPCFMGGEYLPAYKPGEVEIARIELLSGTGDVISVRARPVPGGIEYRVVDEHNWVCRIPRVFSEKPLSLGKLIRLLDEGRHRDLPGDLAIGWKNYNLDGCSRSELRYFTSISSRPYPQLHEHHEHVFEEWVVEGEPEPEEPAIEDEATEQTSKE